MAHYAVLDENNVVIEVIVGKNEDEGEEDWEQVYGEIKGKIVKRTSYNTIEGKHVLGGTPYRKNYAGIGFSYDSVRDAFIPVKPYPSCVLNEETCQWELPVPMPLEPLQDGQYYCWNEAIVNWELKSLEE